MDYTLGDVLREVNNMRFYEFSLPPLDKLPKGTCQSPVWCVIAKCFPLKDKHGYESWTDGDSLCCMGKIFPLPQIIREFITDFDYRCWPSLIDKDVPSIDEDVPSTDSTLDIDSQTPSVVAS
jgi:hypothetical protein